ncbi:glutathione transferase GST 23-like [Phragmites australis]|uniref:glutathione transferase GST 23-like n=1 Tax=Phragmites australis TaxID=29695 RepID=UPI002D76B9F5|nr:glutathione transferase GST 23-like [Phragmites australis]
MAEKGVKVFGMWASPIAIRVEWALRLKGVEYEYIDEDLTDKSDALLRYNPVTKKVPVLVHDGKPIAESTIIVEYIDETWKDGYPIMPADPYERAQARFWARFAEEKSWMQQTILMAGLDMYTLQCNPALYPAFTTTGEAQHKVVQEAQQCLKTLETALDGKKFFGGDAVGYLDVVVGWYAHWLPVIEEVSGASVVTDEDLPLLKAWFDRFLAVDVVKATLPARDRLLAFNKARREQLLSA